MQVTFNELMTAAPSVIKGKLNQLWFLNERPDFHPEPSAMHHIVIVTERLIHTNQSMDLILSGLLHDICKYDCVQINKITGYPTSPNHGQYSSDLIGSSNAVQDFITKYGGDPVRVAQICKYHMKIQRYEYMNAKKKSEMESLAAFQDLLIFTKYDDMLNPEYKLSDVLPYRISSDPTEGGTVFHATFRIPKLEENPIQIAQYEYDAYINLGIYKEIAEGQDFSIKELDPVKVWEDFSLRAKQAH